MQQSTFPDIKKPKPAKKPAKPAKKPKKAQAEPMPEPPAEGPPTDPPTEPPAEGPPPDDDWDGGKGWDDGGDPEEAGAEGEACPIPEGPDPGGPDDDPGGFVPGIVQRYVQIPMTEEDRLSTAHRQNMAIAARDKLARELQAIKADYLGKIKALDLEVSELHRQFENGFTMKNIDCRVEMDFKEGVKRFFDIDTGEVVCIEKMTAADRQASLPGME